MDIVLNPLGVPSRMNIGQIMETHLGWAAKELGKQLIELAESGAAVKDLRGRVKNVFENQATSDLIDSLSDDDFVDAVKKLRDGIVTKTPVFDGATEEEIWSWLSKAGLPDDGKTVLYDGRTGEAFRNRVTTGVMYMLKLHPAASGRQGPVRRPASWGNGSLGA